MKPELRERARALGLERWSDGHLAQLERASAVMERHRQRLPPDLPPEQDPALVFRAKGEAE